MREYYLLLHSNFTLSSIFIFFFSFELDPIEKSLLKQRQRYANLSAAQAGYLEKQKKALENK